MHPYGIVPMRLRSARYLIIREDGFTVTDELSDEILGDLQDEMLHVIDMESLREVLPDLTEEDLLPEESDA